MINKAVLTVTEAAASHIKYLLEKRNKPSLGIRVGVKSGGCHGQKYFIEYADVKNNYDEVIDDKGVKIFVDPKALMYLIGTEMNYIEENFKAGLVFTNPNEKGRCGCQQSFNV